MSLSIAVGSAPYSSGPVVLHLEFVCLFGLEFEATAFRVRETRIACHSGPYCERTVVSDSELIAEDNRY